MKSVAIRLLERERGLFVGALVVGAAAIALGVPVDFVLFALTLAGVALFHHHTLQVALIGLAVRDADMRRRGDKVRAACATGSLVPPPSG